MSIIEQQKIREKTYTEAMRYMDNAKEILKMAGKEGYYYNDSKYVSTACGTAYKGVLIALDAYLKLKDIPARKRKSIEYYTEHIGKIDRKLLRDVNIVYEILHLSGYYDGIHDAIVVQRGMDIAFQIINKIKPTKQNDN